MAQDIVRTTVAVPVHLLEQVDAAVQAGSVRSRNEFVAAALRHELAAREREEIDAAFRAMGEDDEVQEEASLLAREFAPSDWEAFEAGER
jgi:metal-responsive CopG/Arc/MetJ family transcriptional regulator